MYIYSYNIRLLHLRGSGMSRPRHAPKRSFVVFAIAGVFVPLLTIIRTCVIAIAMLEMVAHMLLLLPTITIVGPNTSVAPATQASGVAAAPQSHEHNNTNICLSAGHA